MWEVILLEEVEDWYLDLTRTDPKAAMQVTGAIDLLAAEGPTLGRPAVDRIKGSQLHNLKELRPSTGAEAAVRILFVFDPDRQAVLLVAGNKASAWRDWYRISIPVAEERYRAWLDGHYGREA